MILSFSAFEASLVSFVGETESLLVPSLFGAFLGVETFACGIFIGEGDLEDGILACFLSLSTSRGVSFRGTELETLELSDSVCESWLMMSCGGGGGCRTRAGLP